MANKSEMARKGILLSWSGGKDSTLALLEILRQGDVHIAALLTTVTDLYDRVSMHGVRRVLLERQTAALGLPLRIVYLPADATNREYEARMEMAFDVYGRQGVTTIAFADLFLADIRRYREEWLARVGMQPIFPLWHRDTRDLARSFIDQGFKAVVTCVDGRTLDGAFAGRSFDHRFLADLPETVDPCGENGEFHTFVYGGPLFRKGLGVLTGEIVQREHWYFCDLLPEGGDTP